jgi:hypothetical protein
MDLIQLAASLRRRGRQKGERPVWTDRRIASLKASLRAGTAPEGIQERFGGSARAIWKAKSSYLPEFHHKRGPSPWTFELEGALLNYRICERLPFPEIAKKPEFEGFTKSALIGKYHRSRPRPIANFPKKRKDLVKRALSASGVVARLEENETGVMLYAKVSDLTSFWDAYRALLRADPSRLA